MKKTKEKLERVEAKCTSNEIGVRHAIVNNCHHLDLGHLDDGVDVRDDSDDDDDDDDCDADVDVEAKCMWRKIGARHATTCVFPPAPCHTRWR